MHYNTIILLLSINIIMTCNTSYTHFNDNVNQSLSYINDNYHPSKLILNNYIINNTDCYDLNKTFFDVYAKKIEKNNEDCKINIEYLNINNKTCLLIDINKNKNINNNKKKLSLLVTSTLLTIISFINIIYNLYVKYINI